MLNKKTFYYLKIRQNFILDNDPQFKKNIEDYKKELAESEEASKKMFEKRTKEINELMSHKVKTKSLTKEVEDLKQMQHQQECELKNEKIKSKRLEEENKKLKGIQSKNQEYSKKLFILEEKVKNEVKQREIYKKQLDESKLSQKKEKENYLGEKLALDLKIKMLEEKNEQLETENNTNMSKFQAIQAKYNEKCEETKNGLEKCNKEIVTLVNDYKQIEKDKNGALDALRQLRQEHNILKRTSEAFQTNLKIENSFLKNQIREKTELINNYAKKNVPQLKSFKRSMDDFRNDLNSLELPNFNKLRKMECIESFETDFVQKIEN